MKASLFYPRLKVNLACEQAPSEVGKKFGEQVGAWWLRERSEWDTGEPLDIVFNVPFHPLVIRLLHICQGGN